MFFSINDRLSITIYESRLQLSLDSPQPPLLAYNYFSSISRSLSTTSTGHTIQRFIQEGLDELSLQAMVVVSNHHSKCLTNEEDYNEWKSDPDRIKIPPTVNHLR